MSMTFAEPDLGFAERPYENWLATLTEASVRLDDLQTTMTEVRCLCESGPVSGEQILEVLEKHGV